MDTHRARLLRLCRLLLGDPEEAGDVVQDVFMKAYGAQMQSKVPGDWAAWLTRVAINACRDRRRAGWWMRFRRWSDRVEEVPVAAADPSPIDRVLKDGGGSGSPFGRCPTASAKCLCSGTSLNLTPEQDKRVSGTLSAYRASTAPLIRQLRQAQSALADKLIRTRVSSRRSTCSQSSSRSPSSVRSFWS